MSTQLAPLAPGNTRLMLIDREKQLIVKAQAMIKACRGQLHYTPWSHQEVVRSAKKRLEALQAGLIPVRLGGKYNHYSTLLSMGDYVPPAIAAKAEEVKERLPGAELRVYGWERDALPAERRRRDPVLAAWYGNAHFFVGFWLEVAMPDEELPEFFGIGMPILPKPGRGRPRKALSG